MSITDLLSSLSPEQQALFREKQARLQQESEENSKRQKESKISDICDRTGVSKEEAECGLEICENDEIEVINRWLTEASFKLKIQEMARGTSERFDGENDIEGGRKYRDDEDDDEDSEEDQDDDDDEAEFGKKKKKRSNKRASSASSQSREKLREGYNMDGTKRAATIRLGDALKRLEEAKRSNQEAEEEKKKKKTTEEEEFDESKSSPIKENSSKKKVKKTTTTSSKKEEGDDYTREELQSLQWSEARIKAFLGRKQNPNAYYYRFNAPGEKQATGAWKKDEHDNFMELIKDGVDYHWGILSMKTPGRVGYQCSNYYRKLISDGLIQDPNYSVDSKGKLTFSRGDKRVKTLKEDGSVSKAIRPRVSEDGVKKRPRRISAKKRNEEDDGGDDDDGDDGGNENNRQDSDDDEEEKLVKKINYLLDFPDAMTMKLMETPAISPFGHVLDYTTWLRLLRETPRDTCPFTKQRLTRRDLIKLNKENLEEYRARIVVCVETAIPACLSNSDDNNEAADDDSE